MTATTLLYHLSMLGAVLALVLLVALSRRRGVEGVGALRLLLAAVVLWLVGEANGRLGSTAGERAAWLAVESLGRPLAPALWLLFALRYTGAWRRPSRLRRSLVFAVPAATVALALTNPWHGLVWDLDVVADPTVVACSAPGPWFRWVHLPYAWLAVAAGCGVVFRRGGHGARKLATAPWLFVAVGVPPLLVSVAAGVSGRVRAVPELVPLAFIAGAVPLLYGLARSPLFGLALTTYRTIFESIGEAVLVVDPGRRIVDLNRAAETCFGLRRRLALGLDVRELMASWEELEPSLARRGEARREVGIERAGKSRTLEIHAFTLADGGTGARHLVLARDVSSRRAYEDRMEHLAYHDPLTGLPNRRWLETTGDRLLAQSRREGRAAAVLFVDLDDFKDINDTLGHAAGDELLLEVARRFRQTTRAESTLVRLGGDEFAVLLGSADAAAARVAGERLLDALVEPFHPAGAEVWVGASVGAALFPRHGTAMEDLLRRADVAMYTAKRSRGRIEIYDPETDLYTHERLRLQSELYRALEVSDQLLVYYQPIVDLEAQRVVAVEALVRWQHPEKGFLEPDSFLPMAENARLVPRLDRYVLRKALRDWRAAKIQLAVNVHPRTLADRDYARAVGEELAASGFPPARLMLEITERALADPDGMREALADLAGLGVTLMADDYGTGQSSLIYIRRFPFHGLKIDRTLASGIGQRRQDEAIVEAVAGLATKLGLRLVVEGVETPEATAWLRERGCSIVQGFSVGRARPLEELLERHPELARPRLVAAGAG